MNKKYLKVMQCKVFSPFMVLVRNRHLPQRSSASSECGMWKISLIVNPVAALSSEGLQFTANGFDSKSHQCGFQAVIQPQVVLI